LTVDIPLPGKEGRRKMFDINLKELKVSAKIDWPKLVELTKGCSGADICNICRDAAYMPMRRKLTQIGGIAKISELSQS
jgi:ATP-dependent 26S proteasome regulatory subunit